MDPQHKYNESTDPKTALEARVDQMMDTRSTAPLVSSKAAAAHEAEIAATPPAFADSPASPVLAEEPMVISEPDLPVPDTEIEEDALPDDPQTDALVEDIIVHESDELLAARDAKAAGAQFEPAAHKRSSHSLSGFFGALWHSKLAHFIVFLLVLAGIGGVTAMPTSRYATLNTVGVRSAASLTILDNTTQLPLKNVDIELGERKAKTNQDGVVKFHDLKLGTQALSISQSGFASINRTITLGLGSNPLGDFTLDAVGKQYRFKLTDYLSGKAVKNAEISSGDANAQSDDKGQLVLTVGKDQTGPQAATISANGYRSEPLSLETSAVAGEHTKQSSTIVMVPVQKEIFVSKQSGKYDVFKVDLDGKNKQLLLAASGQEDANISIAPNSGGDEVALVSRRDATKNQDGFPLQALTIIDVDTGVTLMLDHSERIQIVDWLGDKLVYVKIKAGTSAGNPERYQLYSYDYSTTSKLLLATANNFNDVASVQGVIYFAASNNFQGGTSQLVRINPDSTGKQILLDKTEVWNIARATYDNLDLAVLDGQYQYKVGDTAPRKTSDTPGSVTETKFFLDAADGNHALWTDNRDGKGVLLSYNSETSKDTLLQTQSGLTNPVRWLNPRTIIYRVATPAETADYAISLDGGAPKKVTDLTSVGGLSRWNFR